MALTYSGNSGPWYQHLSELNLQIWNLIRLESNFAIMYLQVPNLNRSISADPRNKTAYNRSQSHDPRNGTKNNGSTNGLKTNIDLNDPAIQAKIGNRATKVVEKTIGMIRSESFLVFNWINPVKVHIFCEGQKILRNLHLHQALNRTKVRWRFRQIFRIYEV